MASVLIIFFMLTTAQIQCVISKAETTEIKNGKKKKMQQKYATGERWSRTYFSLFLWLSITKSLGHYINI